MIVRTKNYKLEKKTYINIALKSILRKQGWIAALAAPCVVSLLFYPGGINHLVVYRSHFGTGPLPAFLVDTVLWSNTIGARQNAF